MSQPYKIFNSAEFTNRDAEFERVMTILKEKSRATLIFEGERGGGKTTFLLELYRRLNEQRELRPFFLSLFPYSAPEFKDHENIWLNTERPFQKDDIPDVLNRLAHYFEIESIGTDDRDFQKDYFARGLAYRASKTTPVLVVDSIYECPEDIRIELEKYILAPILTSERVFIILSGRGKRPVWSRSELQSAEIVQLQPLPHDFIIDQLEKLNKQGKLKRSTSEYEAIADISGGNPLVVRIIAESEKSLASALNDAIDVMIQDTLPESENEEKKYLKTRSQIEKLALVDIAFRIPDVETYLYPNDPDGRAKTNKLIALLLASHLARYEGKGYHLNRSVVHPIRKWLALRGLDSEYRSHLQEVILVLQQEYPSAKAWYQRMLPAKVSLPANMFTASNPHSTQYAA